MPLNMFLFLLLIDHLQKDLLLLSVVRLLNLESNSLTLSKINIKMFFISKQTE